LTLKELKRLLKEFKELKRQSLTLKEKGRM